MTSQQLRIYRVRWREGDDLVMTTNQNTTSHANAIRRLTTVVIMGIAPLLITVGTATAAHADTTVSTPDPSFHSPVRHPAFPGQTDRPSPGTPAHHHHQHHSGR